MAWCLTRDQEARFRQALLNKEIDPFKLAEMTSEQRRTLFEKYVDPENAIQINSLYESKLLLKNQVTGFKTWAKRTLGLSPQAKRDLLTKIERLDKVLDPKDLQSFKEDLVRTRLGLNITFEEAKTINKLSEERVKAESAWRNDLNKNLSWTDDPHGTRKEWIGNKNRIEYGLKNTILKNYVDGLKLEAQRISFKEDKRQALIQLAKESPEVINNTTISLVASIDDSFFGRQGIKNLYGSMDQKRIWVRNFIKSFSNIKAELKAQKIDGIEPMDLIIADISSRPGAMSGEYKAGDYRLGVFGEEAFPTSLPEKIPGLGRLFKASETAFNGGALTMRADLADIYISQAKKSGINTLNKEDAKPIGNLVGSLTGRGSLGPLAPAQKYINFFLWAPRFVSANISTVIAPVKFAGAKAVGKFTGVEPGTKGQQFSRTKAAQNTFSIIAHVAGILMIAKFLDPDSVDEDPRSTNFGRIKIFGKWVDITGGMGTLVTLASRLIPTRRNGEWGFWSKSTTGKWTNLIAGEYGQRDGVDIIMDALLLNRLTPLASVFRDMWRGEMFGGEPFDIKKSIIQSTIPLSIQSVNDAKEDGFTPALAVAISEFFGFSVGGYKYEDNWNKKTSKEMINFKEQVGQEKFDQANDAYNRAYNVWLQEVEKDPRYKKLSDEGKEKLKSNARDAIKTKILKEYGYKEKKTVKTKEEKEEEKIIKQLKP